MAELSEALLSERPGATIEAAERLPKLERGEEYLRTIDLAQMVSSIFPLS